MASYLLASNPIHGHVGPILSAARHLVGLGHAVTVLTGSRFVTAVESTGAAFRVLDGRADYDDRVPDDYLPHRHRYRGIRRTEYDIRNIFVETIPDQFRSLSAAVDDLRPDAVLVDGAFAGALPLIARTVDRPAVLALGVTPLTQSSRVTAPHGMGLPPAEDALSRVRYRLLSAVAQGVLFRRTQQAARRAFRECGARLDGFALDISAGFDRFLQTGPASLEYPRPDLSGDVRFVGVIPQSPGDAQLPEWWDEIDEHRPLVHVTQGTIDNHDFGRLVWPTVHALAHRDVTVIVSAGGRPVDALGRLPRNARAASYLPYDALLARADVMVTNGGYGGVQAALAAGVPLVVAGATEDKPEVAARVHWTGAGIDLRSGEPSPEAIGRAVDRVLAEPAFRGNARRIAADAAGHDPLAEIAAHLAETVARPGPRLASPTPSRSRA